MEVENGLTDEPLVDCQETVDQPSLERPYNLRVIGDVTQVVNGAVLHAMVRNTSSKPWTIEHRAGIRGFRDRSGNLVQSFELRAELSPRQIRPGQTAFFHFNFRDLVLADDVVSCTLDIVEDGVAWLGDRGGEPIQLSVLGEGGTNLSDWLFLIDELAGRTDTAGKARLALVQQVLVKHDLKQVANAMRLRKRLQAAAQGLAYTPLQPGSSTILEALPAHIRGEERENILLRHFAALTKVVFDPARPETGGRILARFVDEGAQRFRGACVPLPSRLMTWMDERALPHSVASTSASRAMVSVLGARSPLQLNPDDEGREQIWTYATTVVIDRRLPAQALPSVVLRELVSVNARAGGSLFPVETVFMRRLHTDSAVYRDAYDLSSDTGRLAYAFDLCLLGLENEALRRLLGANTLAWMTNPLSETIDVSLLELMLLALCERPVFPITAETSEEIVRLRQAVDWLAPGRTPPAAPTVRILGLQTSVSGLGTNMRMSERAMALVGIATETVDAERDLAKLPRQAGSARPSRPVDLFHLNPDEVPWLASRYARADRPDTYRIGFALWETSEMPEEHRAGIMLADEIWAPTRYVAGIYERAGHRNVHVVGKGIELPPVQPFHLARLGIAEDVTVFMVAFDLGSWIDRKNPMAAVEAFQRAFVQEEKVCLIVKSNALSAHPGDQTRQVARLQAAANDDPRIILLSEVLEFSDFLGLIQAVHATVSPHRSEGFGYVPAYSMLLETATIVTDHSGVEDFCTEETSFPVRATLHPLAAGEFVFDALGARWAHVDIDHLAERLQQVHADPDEARRRALNGRRLVEDLYSMEALAERYRRRLEAI